MFKTVSIKDIAAGKIYIAVKIGNSEPMVITVMNNANVYGGEPYCVALQACGWGCSHELNRIYDTQRDNLKGKSAVKKLSSFITHLIFEGCRIYEFDTTLEFGMWVVSLKQRSVKRVEVVI